MNTAILKLAKRFGNGYRKWIIPGFDNAVIAGPLRLTIHHGNWPGRILIRVPIDGRGDVFESLWSSSLPGARRKARHLIMRAIEQSTYRHLFYLGDGSGCLKLALRFARDPAPTLKTCPTWTPEPAKLAARERLVLAARTYPKPADLMPA
jgi:hypothetical protein